MELIMRVLVLLLSVVLLSFCVSVLRADTINILEDPVTTQTERMDSPDVDRDYEFIAPTDVIFTRKAPYLIYNGSNTEMEVHWQLYSTEVCLIEWGTDTLYSLGSEETLEYGDDHQHAYIITDLSPGTKYYYRVTVSEETWTGSFFPAPEPDASEVKFLAYGDTRSFPAVHDSVAEGIVSTLIEDPDFQSLALLTGDLVNNGDIEADWDNQFFDPSYSSIQEMLSSVPYQSARGNHEMSGVLFEKYFPYPYLDGMYWSFDYGPAHFVVVDQYTSYGPGSVQLEWIESDLASTMKRWKFLYLHAPGWSAGGHSNNWSVQNYIQPLCEQYGVSIVFAGHNHYYARAVVNDVQHITTGGGGAPLYSPNPGYPNIVAADMSYHFCKIEIDGSNLNFAAVTPEGSVIDEFTIESGGIIIHVPDDYATIQAGIDAAVDGDTVLVADGTYTGDGNRDIDFGGKAIVVMSENGAESCIIDCEGNVHNITRGFYFHSGEDAASILQGFTIMNGWQGAYGAGIYCKNASPTIRENIILNNEVGHNSFFGWGGGIYCLDASPIIEHNIIKGNWALVYGGGISCYSSNSMILNNTIYENISTAYGGGIYSGESNLTITGNTIVANATGTHGTNKGGGIFCEESSNLLITNSILWDNWSEEGEEIYISDASGNPSTVSIGYSDVSGGQDNVVVEPGCTLNWGDGMIDDDPQFVLPNKRDYRLLWDSPCIDSGHPDSLDADGTRSDMGAHFFDQNDYLTLYMTPDATEVAQGGHMGVTYTIINRWQQKEPFSVLTRAILPDGEIIPVLGPEEYNICTGYTAQIHLTYDIPPCAYVGIYKYQAAIGLIPSTLYDRDNFKFRVTE
jgi:hypothetical protein